MFGRRTKNEEPQAARQAVWRQISVRHRAPGYLRLDLPSFLCQPVLLSHIQQGLMACDGVYRVHVFAGSGKMSIRWTEDVCTVGDVVRCLTGLLESGPTAVPVPGSPPVVREDGKEPTAGVSARPPVPWRERWQAMPVVRQWRDRLADWRGRAQMLSQLIAIKNGRAGPLPFDAKDWAIHFLNDLVVFYLIRVHWDRIMRQWLPAPWAYRTQWMTVIYLIFLLVRFRKTGPNSGKLLK